MVLIETLWNVNINLNEIIAPAFYVLIETLWNVNKLDIVTNKIGKIVLIETLWNVNSTYLCMIGSQIPY